jgi:hypothetical protein
VEGGDVRIAAQGLGVGRDHVEVEQRHHLDRPEPALEALDDVDVRIGEHRFDVPGPGLGVPGHVVVSLPHARPELHVVPEVLPPLDAAEDLGPVEEGTGGCRDADGAAVGERPAEQRGRLHEGSSVGSRRWGIGLSLSSRA